jgi:hypothetical protein
MEDAVVHELDPVYHPLELQEKRYKQHSTWGEKGEYGLEKSHAHILKIKNGEIITHWIDVDV